MLGVLFILNLVQGYMDSVDPLSRLHLAVSSKISGTFSSHTLLYCRTKYALGEPYMVLCLKYNKVFLFVSKTNLVASIRLLTLSELYGN